MSSADDRNELMDRVHAAAHDIRQMLGVVRGHAALLLMQDGSGRTSMDQTSLDQAPLDQAPSEQEPSEQEKRLRAIDLAAADAARILDRLEGRQQPTDQAASIPLAAIVRQALDLIQPGDGQGWFSDEGHWRAQLDESESVGTSVPAQVVREVLANLLTNALQAMGEGGQIRLEVQRHQDRVRLTCEDDGPGVPAHLADRIFQRGFSTSGEAGRGLGLAGCRDLLACHGAGLALEDSSALGGALFALDLPWAPPAAEPSPDAMGQAATTPAATTPAAQPPAMKILLVEDEPAVQDMMHDLLSTLGHDLHLAGHGQQALEAFTPGRFPVVILDQSLPGKTGLEIAMELRARDPRVVLVLVSGWGNEDILDSAVDQGVDLTARKPLTVDRIRQLLAEAGLLLDRRKG